MKFNTYKSVAMCSLLALLAGCHDFEEMNTNPYQPVYDPSVIGGTGDGIDIDYEVSDNALQSLRVTEGSAGATFSNFVYEGMYNDYQTTTNLTHDVYAGYWGNNAFAPPSAPTYSYNDGWSGTRWRHFYDDRTVSEYSQLIKTFWFCDRDYYQNAFYITRIYYAFLMSAQTDTYGDIPIKYYVKGMLPPEENVEYSSQEDVYGMIFDILDQAITNLHNPTLPTAQQFSFGEDDLCYGGDVESWIRFANTLRLRLALRISNVNPSLAKQQGEAALSDPSGLMASQDDNMRLIPKHRYNGGNENIYALLFSWSANVVLPKELEWAYKNQALRPGVTTATSGFEQKAPADLYTAGGVDETMFNASEDNCYLDPRCSVLWYRPTSFDLLNQAIPEESDNDFGGIRNGETDLGGRFTTIYSPNRCNLQNNPDAWWNLDQEIVWFGYAESLFLKAEAALRGWNGTSLTQSAKDYYLDGIRASMEYYGIAESDYSDYINNLQGLAAFDGGSQEEQLEQIITQKWIAVFPNGNEGWAELRRTDYPRYALVVQGGNGSNGEVPNTKLIKRVQYPNSESRNPLKPTQYTQGTRVWWDVADTMDDDGKWHQPNNFR